MFILRALLRFTLYQKLEFMQKLAFNILQSIYKLHTVYFATDLIWHPKGRERVKDGCCCACVLQCFTAVKDGCCYVCVLQWFTAVKDGCCCVCVCCSFALLLKIGVAMCVCCSGWLLLKMVVAMCVCVCVLQWFTGVKDGCSCVCVAVVWGQAAADRGPRPAAA